MQASWRTSPRSYRKNFRAFRRNSEMVWSTRFEIKNPGIEWTRDTGDCLPCGTKKTFYIIQNSVNQS